MSEAARRRALILEVADRLLRHYGPNKTTVADVAREAGVGVGTVYLEFSSKDAIVEELSRSRHHKILAAMRAAATAARKTHKDRLSGAFDARLEAYLAIADEGVHACDLVHCGGSKPREEPAPSVTGVKTALAGFRDEEQTLVVEVLRRGVEAGELEVEDAEATARAILCAYASFVPPWIVARDRDEVRRSIAVMHQLVLFGVARRSARKPKR